MTTKPTLFQTLFSKNSSTPPLRSLRSFAAITDCLLSCRPALLALLLLIPSFAKAALDANAVVLAAPTIKEKGPHHRVWQTVDALQIADRTIYKTNSYTELQSAKLGG